MQNINCSPWNGLKFHRLCTLWVDHKMTWPMLDKILIKDDDRPWKVWWLHNTECNDGNFWTPWTPTGARSRNSLQNPASLRNQNSLVRMSSKSITFCSSEWSFRNTYTFGGSSNHSNSWLNRTYSPVAAAQTIVIPCSNEHGYLRWRSNHCNSLLNHTFMPLAANKIVKNTMRNH